jgi:hypothetical protein
MFDPTIHGFLNLGAKSIAAEGRVSCQELAIKPGSAWGADLLLIRPRRQRKPLSAICIIVERLQAPLHHDPSPGSAEAQMIYHRQYAETLALHERFFGPPSPEFWPATHLRFARPRYHITDRSRWLIMPKPIAWIRRLFRR